MEETDEGFVAGWGDWAGNSKAIKSKEMLRKKRLRERAERQKTAEKSNLTISNKLDKKFTKYTVQTLPHPFKTQEEFDRASNAGALGVEVNTLSTYKQMIQPAILKKIGKIIEPLNAGDEVKAAKISDIIQRASKKVKRTKTKI